MGAALTYARRYGLFTLVGIAGEDDVDAPDTGVPQKTAANDGDVLVTAAPAKPNGHAPTSASQQRIGSERTFKARHIGPTLSPSESIATRKTLINDLVGLVGVDELTAWALQKMTVKNALVADDARAVEAEFQVRLADVAGSDEGRQRRHLQVITKPLPWPRWSANMRDRIESVGGTLDIRSKPGKGTSVIGRVGRPGPPAD